MGRFDKLITKLDENSEYHSILLKNLGYQGALRAINSAILASSFDRVSYKAAVKWKPRGHLSPSLAK